MPFRRYNWKTSVETCINSKKEDIWRIISREGNLAKFHPFCRTNKIVHWSKKKHIDEIEYLNGLIFRRNFVQWIDNLGYDLYIHQLGKPNSYVSWRIKELEEGSKIKITVYPYLFNNGQKFISYIPFFLIVRPLLRNYLSAVLHGLKLYIEEDSLIKPNQFGKHIWFS